MTHNSPNETPRKPKSRAMRITERVTWTLAAVVVGVAVVSIVVTPDDEADAVPQRKARSAPATPSEGQRDGADAAPQRKAPSASATPPQLRDYVDYPAFDGAARRIVPKLDEFPVRKAAWVERQAWRTCSDRVTGEYSQPEIIDRIKERFGNGSNRIITDAEATKLNSALTEHGCPK